MRKHVRPFLSVVIPALNEEAYLGACLASMNAQTLPKHRYEVIVVDNGSKDKTADIARNFGVQVVREKRKSVARARQKGLIRSRGEIIVSADADTRYPTFWLERIEAQFRKNSNLVGLVGWIYFTNSPTIIRFSIAIFQQLNSFIMLHFNKVFLAFACNFAFRKNVAMRSGGYRFHLPELGDQFEILLRLKKEGDVRVNKSVFCFTSSRRHSSVWKTIVVYNFWHRIVGYLVNKRAGRVVIGPATPVRIVPVQKSHFSRSRR